MIDYRDDLEEARQARLRATGGATEVAWVMGPGGLLYRGVRGPPGPPGSLFSDEDAYELALAETGETSDEVATHVPQEKTGLRCVPREEPQTATDRDRA